MSPEDVTELTGLAKEAAKNMWAKFKDKTPNYPSLDVWLVMALKLRAEERTELLTPEGHQIFVGAYEAEIKALIHGTLDLNTELAELGKEAARDAWLEYEGEFDKIPNVPELNAWAKRAFECGLLEADRPFTALERRVFIHAYRNELQVAEAEDHAAKRR